MARPKGNNSDTHERLRKAAGEAIRAGGHRDAGRIIAAWCELREEFRFFRTNRLISADVLEQRIPEVARALKARWQAAMNDERATYFSADQDKP